MDINLLKTVVQYGFMTVFAAITLKLLYRYFNSLINKKIDKAKYSLEYHHFFAECNSWISVDIPQIPIDDKNKKRIIVKFLTIKFETVRDKFLHLAQDTRILEKNNEEFSNIIRNTISDIIKTYENAFRVCYPVEVSEFIIEKFGKWHNKRTTIFINNIDSILASRFHRTNCQKFTAVLDAVCFIMDMTIIDAEKANKDLNGDLTKLIKKFNIKTSFIEL